MPADSTPDLCAVSLVVPTLNQAKNIERLIDRAYQPLSQVADRLKRVYAGRPSAARLANPRIL